MAKELTKEERLQIIEYTKEVIREINTVNSESREEEADRLIDVLSKARRAFLELEIQFSPNVKNKEINERLTILAKVQSGVVSEKQRIIEELEYQNHLLYSPTGLK